MGLGHTVVALGTFDEIAVVGEGLVLGPGLDQYVHAFLELLSRVFQGYPEAGHLVGLVTSAHAADEAAVDQVVQHCHLFRQPQDVPDGHHQDASGDLQSLGPLADVKGLQQGRGRIAVIGEMVLGNEAVVKAHCLRVLNLLHTFLK